jgi:predicted nucleic acid-binding protein
MKVLVDTSVWSLALRRKETSAVAEKLADLIRASMAVLIGPVRQELLSGISDEKTFLRLKSKLEYFDNPPITALDYETAARFYNTCRSHGVQGSHIDFLICAVAANNELLIFTTDQDFERYAMYLPIRFLKIET